jgi:L-seryl-tRNA(Ser) seleniumtransferase
VSSETSKQSGADAYRALPSVDRVLVELDEFTRARRLPHFLVAQEVRAVLDERRAGIASGLAPAPASVSQEVSQRLLRLLAPSLRQVINATGVILHTNLGRAPLAHFTPISGYSNLEYDLAVGKRGKRDQHWQPLLERLLGCHSLVVNNNAAAVYLVLASLAGDGGEVIVSRGELIEIGDGFRIPEIMARSGAAVREVGTTNRTRVEDYRVAVNERTRLILRVHPSNFHVTGFTARPALTELAALAREAGIPLYEDLGSGCIADLRRFGIREPLVSESLAGGVNLVSFSCDKLLGGPQSGIIAGDQALVERVRRHPMYRTFRVDKLILEALEVTLRHLLTERWEELPAMRALAATPEEVRGRAERLAGRLPKLNARVVPGESKAGGGSTPDQALPTWLLQIEVAAVNEFERRLRAAPLPVIARIEDDRLTIDLRTVAPEEEDALVAAVEAASEG